jgi:hypothetical protein
MLLLKRQYVDLLKLKKLSLLESSRNSRSSLFKCDFTLLVELVNLNDDIPGLSPLKPVPIWRRIVVSGGMNLAQLHDRVLAPAVGWVRNYHGYLFTDPKDGALFGPEDCSAVDMMHMPRNGHTFCSDKEIKLAELIQSPGDFLLYVYDLGDTFRHRLTLEAVAAPEDSTGALQLLEGAGACPPEDSIGLPEMGCKGVCACVYAYMYTCVCFTSYLNFSFYIINDLIIFIS